MTNRADLARTLMMDFSEETGITSPSAPNRYLWTDAHAVCNFLTFWQDSGDSEYFELAERLISQVHAQLGRYHADDARSGWLSGLSDQEAERHPTAGGLRIGKPLLERAPQDPHDEATEWDRDGQYFHYLTKWAHALCAMAGASKDDTYWRWATELMGVAHDRFHTTYDPAGLYWKMRVDLSAPLVASSNPHDALDGAVTCLALSQCKGLSAPSELKATTEALFNMCHERRWHTTDALGLGGLLFDACRLAQLHKHNPSTEHERLLQTLLADTADGVRIFAQPQVLTQLPSHRLAFRELGLVIGLQALDQLYQDCKSHQACLSLLDQLHGYKIFGEELLDYWSQEAHRHNTSWIAHEDINNVMLATALAPHAFLTLQ